VLSLRPVQWLGDNSYAVYLWHWPLLIAAPWLLHGPVSSVAKVAIAGSTCVLAAVTKRLVEDPIRGGRRWQSRRWPAYALAVGGVAAVALVASMLPTSVKPAAPRLQAAARAQEHRLVASTIPSCFGAEAMLPVNDCAQPFMRPPHLDLASAAADGRTDGCLQNGDFAAPTFCTLGVTRSPVRTIAIVGNSHAWRLVPAFALYARQHRWEVVVASRSTAWDSPQRRSAPAEPARTACVGRLPCNSGS
jgi:hypothetical protein